jgi:hypothetical protein
MSESRKVLFPGEQQQEPNYRVMVKAAKTKRGEKEREKRTGRDHTLDQLPAVEGVEEVNVAGGAIENLDREGTFGREDLRGFLVRVHAVPQRHLQGQRVV